ncbi:MAG: hypothetical protein ACRD3W_09455, partial [Terriglobales bacterium]
GDVSEDIVLQPGDTVYVPKGGSEFPLDDFGRLVTQAPKVRVMGAVNSPGVLSMAPDDDLITVITKSGGFSPTAVKKYILLARTNRDGTVSTQKVNVTQGIFKAHSAARDKIRPGDIVLVKTSPSKVVAKGVARLAPQMMMSAMMSIFLSRINTIGSSR